MEYLHVVNIDKHNSGYKDRKSIWLKFHFSCYNDQAWDRLCEIDQMRFINFIRLQIVTKAPVLLDNEYLKSQGFKLKNRCITSTVRQLAESNLVEIRSEADQQQVNSRLEADQQQTNSRPTADQQQKPKIVAAKGLTTKSVTQSRVEKSRVYKNTKNVNMSLFNHWNKLGIMVHKDSSKYLPSINASLKNYSEHEITDAMNNYVQVLHGEQYYWTHKWTLKEFLTRGLDKFLTINKPLDNHQSKTQSNRLPSGVAL